jgi:DNA polymerase I
LPEEEQQQVKAGSVIQYVKSRREPRVKLLAIASKDEVDVDKYVEHIQTTFEQVLDALDISFNEIIGVSKLESFI